MQIFCMEYADDWYLPQFALYKSEHNNPNMLRKKNFIE